MFESLAAPLLAPLLSTYFEDITQESVSVKVTTGRIELTNLRFKETALRECGVPLTVVWGSIGKLIIKLSWKNPFSRPFNIEVDKIQLVLANPADAHLDDEAIQRYILLVKRRWAERFYDDDNVFSEEEQSRQRAFFYQLLQNGDLFIGSIHARFDEHDYLESSRGSFGILLTSLEFGTSIEKKSQISYRSSEDVPALNMAKQYSIADCRLYWESKDPRSSDADLADFSEFLDSYVINSDDVILSTGQVTGRLQLSNHEAEAQFDMETALTVSQVSASLSTAQYTAAVSLLAHLSESALGVNAETGSGGMRPTAPVKETPRQWWLYVYDSVVHSLDIPSRRSGTLSWPRILLGCYRRREYVAAYTLYLSGISDISVVENFDRELDVRDIILFRRIAMANQGKTQGKLSSKRSLLQRALRWTRRLDLTDSLREDREKFLSQIADQGFGEIVMGSINLSVTIPSAYVTLLDTKRRSIVKLNFSGVEGNFLAHPSTSAVLKTGLCSSLEVMFPSATSDCRSHDSDESTPLFRVSISQEPQMKAENGSSKVLKQTTVQLLVNPITLAMTVREAQAVQSFFAFPEKSMQAFNTRASRIRAYNFARSKSVAKCDTSSLNVKAHIAPVTIFLRDSGNGSDVDPDSLQSLCFKLGPIIVDPIEYIDSGKGTDVNIVDQHCIKTERICTLVVAGADIDSLTVLSSLLDIPTSETTVVRRHAAEVRHLITDLVVTLTSVIIAPHAIAEAVTSVVPGIVKNVTDSGSAPDAAVNFRILMDKYISDQLSVAIQCEKFVVYLFGHQERIKLFTEWQMVHLQLVQQRKFQTLSGIFWKSGSIEFAFSSVRTCQRHDQDAAVELARVDGGNLSVSIRDTSTAKKKVFTTLHDASDVYETSVGQDSHCKISATVEHCCLSLDSTSVELFTSGIYKLAKALGFRPSEYKHATEDHVQPESLVGRELPSLCRFFMPHSRYGILFEGSARVNSILLSYSTSDGTIAFEPRTVALVVEIKGSELIVFGDPFDACESRISGCINEMMARIDRTPCALGGATDSKSDHSIVLLGNGLQNDQDFLVLSTQHSRKQVLLQTTEHSTDIEQVFTKYIPTKIYVHVDNANEYVMEFASKEAASEVLNSSANSNKNKRMIWAPSANSQINLQVGSIEAKLDTAVAAIIVCLANQILNSTIALNCESEEVGSPGTKAMEETHDKMHDISDVIHESGSTVGCPLKRVAQQGDGDDQEQALLFCGAFMSSTVEFSAERTAVSIGDPPTSGHLTLSSPEFTSYRRSLQVQASIKARFVSQRSEEHSRLNVDGLQIDSFDTAGAESKRLNCVAPCSVFATRMVNGNETVSCAVGTESICATIVNHDVQAVAAWIESVQSIVSRDQIKPSWNQDTVPVAPSKIQVASRLSRAVSGQYASEQATIGITYINLTFANQVKQGHRPIALFSGSVEADLQNWTSSLSGNANMKVAAAVMDVKRSAWEPLLLASPDANDQITPWSLQLQAYTPPSDWIDSNAFVVCKQQNNRKSKKTSHLLLDDDMSTYWDAGTSKGDNWVIFEFQRVITLHQFRYYPRKSTIAGVNVPKLNVLEVGESRQGPFQLVVDFTGPLGSSVVRSPAFSATGKFWKWTIQNRYGSSPGPAHVIKVEFAQRAGGTMLELTSEQASELTISTESLIRLHELSASWSKLQHTTMKDAETETGTMHSPILGSHKLVNLTGIPIAVVKGATFSPSGAVEVADKSSVYFEFGDRATESNSMNFTIDKHNPITHIDIIDIRAGEKAPRGWITIKKDINRGRGDCTQFLIYKRDTDTQPITDIHLRYSDPNGSPYPSEPVPAGFEEVPRDLHGRNYPGTRPIFLSVRRGCGAPLMDVALAYINDNESLPNDFVALPRLVNTGYEGAYPVQIGYRRHAAEYTSKGGEVRRPPIETDRGHGGLKGSEIFARLTEKKKNSGASSKPQRIAKQKSVEADSGSITGITVYSTIGKDGKRKAALSDHGSWQSRYRVKKERVDISDGQANPTYILHTRERGFPSITSLRIVSNLSTAAAHVPSGSPTKSISYDEEKQADGWIRLLPALNVGNASGVPLMWLEFRRDVGASPVESIDFIYAESEPVPEGYMMLDPTLSMVTNKGRIFKKRDVRLVYRLGEPPRMSFKLIKDDDNVCKRTALVDSGVARIGSSIRREKDVVVETNVALQKAARPTITAAPCPSHHAAEFVFVCKAINEHSFSINCRRVDVSQGWPHDLHVRWTAMGDVEDVARHESSGVTDTTGSSPALSSSRRVRSASIKSAQGERSGSSITEVHSGVESLRPTSTSPSGMFSSNSGEGSDPSPAVAKLLALEALNRSRFKVPQISFEVRGWYPVSHVEVFQESVRTIVLMPKWHGLKKARVSISVEIVDETRLITISSPLVIRNNLEMRMHLCYQQSLHDETILATIDPGSRFTLPLGIMDKTPDMEHFIPLWRFWSQEQNCPFYTTNPMDFEYLGTTDWVQQSALGYLYRFPVPGTVPLWIRQPMDFLDSLPGVTTNRLTYSLEIKVGPKPDHRLAEEGYRQVGHVYIEPQPNCNALLAYVNLEDQFVLFTTDSLEVHTDDPKWKFCGIECYLPLHHGMLRVRPDQDSACGKPWGWSKEILHLHRNCGPPSRSLLCVAQQAYKCHMFECFIQSRLNCSEWTLESPIYIENSLPNNIYIAMTSSPDEPPGSHCITIAPGERYKTTPIVLHTMETSAESTITNFAREYDTVEIAKRGTYLWLSLNATSRKVLEQGVTQIGKHDTKRGSERGPEVAPIKVIELLLSTELDLAMVENGLVHVDARVHRGCEEGSFTFNKRIISSSRVAIQVVRTDSFDGWSDELFIAWEVWVNVAAASTPPRLQSPQVALRDWSQPARLTWDDTVLEDKHTEVEFSGASNLPEEMCLRIRSTKSDFGSPTSYMVFAQHHVLNLTGCDIEISDHTGKRGLWYAASDDKQTGKTGLFSLRRSSGIRLSMNLSREQMIDLGYDPRMVLWETQSSFQLETDMLTLDDLTGIQLARLEVASSSEVGEESESRYPSVLMPIRWRWGNQSKLWKFITISPQVIIENLCSETVSLGYLECLSDQDVHIVRAPVDLLKISTNERVPVVVNSTSRRWMLHLPETDWSCDFPIDNPSVTVFTLKLCGKDGSLVALDIRIKETEFSRVLTVSPSARAPYRLENHCEAAIIMFYQEPGLEDGPDHIPPRYLLYPGLMMSYALDRCDRINRFRVFIEDAFLSVQSRDGDGILVDPQMDAPMAVNYSFISEGTTRQLYIFLLEDNGTRVIIFSDSIGLSRRLYGLPEDMPSEYLRLELSVALPRVGISIVDSTPNFDSRLNTRNRLSTTCELFYVCVNGILINYSSTSVYIKRHFTVSDILINHQHDRAAHQVFLCSASYKSGQSSGREDSEWTPLLQVASVTKLAQVGYGRGFPSESHIAFSIQTTCVNVDAQIVESCKRLAFIYRCVFGDSTETTSSGITEAVISTKAKVFDHIKIYPLEVLLTTSFEDLEQLSSSFGVNGLLYKVMTATVGKVHELPFKFNGLELENLSTTSEMVARQVHRHMWNQAISFMSIHGMLSSTNVLGSLELFGDVNGVIRGLGGSIRELSAVSDDDSFESANAFGAQLGRGTVKFSSGVLGNVASMGSKITGSLSSGLAVFAMDESYRRERKSAMAKKPSGFGHGLVSGVTQLGKGVMSGVSGLVEKPIRGGQKGGFVGSLGGLGKGIAGLVIKPVTGAVDMIQSSLAGLESLAVPSSRHARVRDPRYIDPSGVITPYSWHKSMGRRFILESFDGVYANDGYISHVSEEMHGGKVKMIFVMQRHVLVLYAHGKQSLHNVKIEKEIDSHRLEGLRMLPGRGIELWYTGSGAVTLFCHDRNVSRLSALLGDLIALHQRSRRSRIASSSQCFFPDRSMVNKMTQRVLAGPRKAKVHQSVLREVWENQRYIPWVGFTTRLLPTDRAAWSSQDGTTSYSEKRAIRPSPGWRWTGEWVVDADYPSTDGEGWQYAVDFPASYSNTYNKFSDFVRRRRWTRQQEAVEPNV